MGDTKYVVSSTPHIRTATGIREIMRDVLIGLSPATLAAFYFFGLHALLVVGLCVGTAVFWEWLVQKVMKRSCTIGDLSAAVTGLLLALNLPPLSPVWMPVVGTFFAIVVVKQLFGGLGQNFINPALAARAFLMASYSKAMTGNFTNPVSNFFAMDAVSAVTPLTVLRETGQAPVYADYINALFGSVSGCIGETSALALIIGGLYLLFRRVISWRIPITYIATVFMFSAVLGRGAAFSGYPFYELITGGLLLGAFFMATDYSTSPVTPVGQLIMGFGCGLLTVIIRVYGGYPEGTSYAILLMNLTVPLIDRFTRPRVFGVRKGAKANA